MTAADLERLRPRAFAVAYRMLGSVAEAEDVVQEALVRIHREAGRDGDGIASLEAFTTTVVTRLAIDALRSARARREEYVGEWLPEPVVTDGDPADRAELADSLEVAFLVLLETLSPEQRAVYLLHDVFAYSHAEIAAIVGKSPAAVRQLAVRARRHVEERRRRERAGAGAADQRPRAGRPDAARVGQGGAPLRRGRDPAGRGQRPAGVGRLRRRRPGRQRRRPPRARRRDRVDRVDRVDRQPGEAAPPRPLSQDAGVAKGERTRQQIVEAAFATLRTRGFHGSTSRAIAEVGGFNPALTFYHFGTVHDVLVAALQHASEERLERYAPEARAAGSAGELLALMRRIYADDVESGFVRVATEMVAGGVAHPELGPRVVALMQPWIDLAEESFARVAEGTPLDALAAPRDLASAAVMLYLGGNLLTRLVPERAELDRLLEAAERGAALADALTGRG